MTELTLRRSALYSLLNPPSGSVTRHQIERSGGDNAEAEWMEHLIIPVTTTQDNELVTEEAGWAAKVRKNLAKWMEENPY